MALALRVTTAPAQDLEARTYVNAPVGVNFALLAYGYSTGNVLVDQALPVEEGQARLNSIVGRYVRTIDVFGLSGKINAIVPFTTGTFEGVLNGQFASTSRSNLADPRLEFSVNLVGAPALKGREFAGYRQRTIVGASVQVIVPVGEYNPDKLVNLGSNRWSFRPQIGISHAAGRWHLELYGSTWLFTDNSEYFGGTTLEQKPIYAVQGHVSYTFRPGLWVALGGGHARGGRTTVDGALRNDLQENSRFGTIVSLPLARRHGLKLVFSSGIATRIGADFDSFGVAYQFRWGGGV